MRILLMAIIFPLTINAGWHDRKCEGWAYYEEKNVHEEVEEEKIAIKSPSDQLQDCKKEMDDTLATAILEPTEENIHNYLELQNKWLNRASDVSKIWAKVVLENPVLDNSISGSPVSSYGTKFYHKQKVAEQKEIIEEVSKNYGLLCFYEGKSEASKEFAKVIKIFSERYDWVVQPISVDGIMIEEFPSTVKDNGLSDQLYVTHYPAIYALNPKTKEATPIGFGLISVDMIENNIVLQFKENFEKIYNMEKK
jgi:conjugal transfer pilus assembly protein TraF